MRLEDLKQQYPETPEFIHQMILDEVEKQMKNNTMNEWEAASRRKKRKRPWTFKRTAAAVLAASMALGTVGFAAVSIYHLSMKENGKYGVDTGITSDTDEGKRAPLPEKISDVKIQADYIPEGMQWRDEDHLEYKENRVSGAFSMITLLLDTESDELDITDTDVIEKEKTEFGDHDGIYIKMKSKTEFNQKIYLLCPEVHRILIMHIGEDVAREEAYKVASGIKLVETGEMLDTSEVWSWSEYVGQETETEETSEIRTSVPKKDIPIHEIGEAFPLDVSGTDVDGNYVRTYDPEMDIDGNDAQTYDPGIDVEVKVDSVEIADDLSLLDEEFMEDKCKDSIGPDGKLVKNQLSYIKKGDGIHTLDETIRTEEVDQKLVLVTVSYTNKGDKEIDNVCYNGNILLINETDDDYRIYSYDSEIGDIAGSYDEISGQAYDYIEQTGFTGRGRIYSSLRSDFGMGGNYIPALKPGESVQVKMAWITNETDLENMYLNLCDTGGLWEFSEDMTETGIVDIRQ